MMRLDNNVIFVEAASELPQLPHSIGELYAALETLTDSPYLKFTSPWHNCYLLMVGLTWDDNPNIYVGPPQLLKDFFVDALKRSARWISHKLKVDAHVVNNNLKYAFTGEYFDTLTLATLVDSDRERKLAFDMSPELAKRCGVNVIATRRLAQKLQQELPSECSGVWATERKLTRTLIDMERRGLRIDLLGVSRAHSEAWRRMEQIDEELKKQLGYRINPRLHADCVDLFVNRYGLPKIRNEESDGPSFDKDVLEAYRRMPRAPVEIIDLILDYRHQATLCELFWENWQELHVDQVLHSDYTQCVSSGRMSCSQPNIQQVNDEAKSLIKPRPGYSFVVHDYSQIEHRFIIHYTGNKRIINEYAQNPELDFHQLMADEAGVTRDAAKTLNLAMGYGMGRDTTVARLSRDESIIEATGGDPHEARRRAISVYEGFHQRLPELKPNARDAEATARRRGYVCNAYGRRCHLPEADAHKAFNRVCQSHAADLIKERANALAEAAPQFGAHLLALVHDEVLAEVPTECVAEFVRVSTEILNQSSVPLLVPIRCKCGHSAESWLKAKGAMQ